MLGQLDGQPGRGAGLRAGGERTLGDPVLQRVVAEHGDPSAHGQRVDRRGQGGLPGGQLAVDLDPQGLEGPLGRVPAAALRGGGDDRAEQLDEPAGGRERFGDAVLDDGAGDRAGEPFLAVLPQDPGQVVDVVGVEDVGRGGAVRLVHAHVERGVDAVGEAAVLLVELKGRDAEVEEGGVHGPQPERRHDRGELVVHRVDQREPVRIRREALPREVECLLVAVDPDEAGLGAALEDALGVATHPQGAVDADGPRLGESRLEQLDDPVAQDGSVSLRGWGFRHTGALWSCRVCVVAGRRRRWERDLGSGPHPLAGCLSRWPGTGEVVPGRQRLEAGAQVLPGSTGPQKRPGTTSSDWSAKASSLASR